jgi:hypothetical protein
LYCGEVLLDIGTAHLVSFFNMENSEKWLNRVAKWFGNLQQFGKETTEIHKIIIFFLLPKLPVLTN